MGEQRRTVGAGSQIQALKSDLEALQAQLYQRDETIKCLQAEWSAQKQQEIADAWTAGRVVGRAQGSDATNSDLETLRANLKTTSSNLETSHAYVRELKAQLAASTRVRDALSKQLAKRDKTIARLESEKAEEASMNEALDEALIAIETALAITEKRLGWALERYAYAYTITDGAVGIEYRNDTGDLLDVFAPTRNEAIDKARGVSSDAD